jgi:hypothetical protein
MRRIVLATALLFIAAGSGMTRAADTLPASTLFDQYHAATTAFLNGAAIGDFGDFYVTVHKQILQGIEGTWVPLNYLEPKDGDFDLIRSACKRNGLALSAQGDYTLKMTRQPGRATEVSSYFVEKVGSWFVESTDAAALFRYLGVDGDKVSDQIRGTSLAGSNGIVNILRPSADILVEEPLFEAPTILGRCPPPAN